MIETPRTGMPNCFEVAIRSGSAAIVSSIVLLVFFCEKMSLAIRLRLPSKT